MEQEIENILLNSSLTDGEVSRLTGELLNLDIVSGCFPTQKELEEKNALADSWGNTSHPDECYKQGLKDMYEAIVKELNNR